MEQRLRKSVLYTFGLGDLGFSLMVSMETMFFAAFLTDYAKFPLAIAGMILTITSFADIICAPTAGIILEKSNLKYGGKYRSWLLVGPPIIAILFIFQFTKIGSDNVAATIICIGFILSHLLWNTVFSAHISLVGKITYIPDERTLLSANRAQYQSAASLIFSYVGMPLIALIGSYTTPVLGYTYSVAFWSVIMILAYWYVYRLTKGRDPYDTEAQRSTGTTSTKEMIRLSFKNPQLLILLITEVFRNSYQFIITGFAFYYFKYVIDDLNFLPVYLLVTNLMAFFGAMIGGKVALKLGKKNTYLLGILVLAICLVSAKFFGLTPWTFTLFVGLGLMFSRFANVVVTALFADTVIYGEYVTGVNTRGFIMSLLSLPIKAGVFVRSFIMTAGLAAIGYVADAPATESVVTGISSFMTILPATIAICCVIIFFLAYKLDNKKILQMQDEINKRNGINI